METTKAGQGRGWREEEMTASDKQLKPGSLAGDVVSTTGSPGIPPSEPGAG